MTPQWLAMLPTINACFNFTSALCLALGFGAIKYGKRDVHKRLMITALISSALFLVGYLTRVFNTGTHRFVGAEWLRWTYLGLLGTHMFLAIVMLPLIALTFFYAFSGRFEKHRGIAKYTWPIWMYVSVTGVIVYFMLYHLSDSVTP